MYSANSDLPASLAVLAKEVEIKNGKRLLQCLLMGEREEFNPLMAVSLTSFGITWETHLWVSL